MSDVDLAEKLLFRSTEIKRPQVLRCQRDPYYYFTTPLGAILALLLISDGYHPGTSFYMRDIRVVPERHAIENSVGWDDSSTKRGVCTKVLFIIVGPTRAYLMRAVLAIRLHSLAKSIHTNKPIDDGLDTESHTLEC